MQEKKINIAKFARLYGEEMLSTIVLLARDPETPAATKLAAAKEILDRGFGKSALVVEISDGAERMEEFRQLMLAAAEAGVGGKVIDVTPVAALDVSPQTIERKPAPGSAAPVRSLLLRDVPGDD